MRAAAAGLPANAWAYVVPTALPFLFPLTAGPSVNVWQLLMSWACAVGLWLLAPRASIAPRLAAWLASTIFLLLCGRGAGWSATLPAALSVVVVFLSACAGAGMVGANSSHPVRSAAGPTGEGDQRGKGCDGVGVGGWAWGLLVAGLASGVLGLFQYYGLADALVPFASAPDVGQAHGNLRQRNQFASLISMAMIALLWLHASRHVGRASGHRWFVAASAVVLVVASAASTSRTGLLQLLLVAGIAAFIGWRERRVASKGEARSRLPHRMPHPVWAVAAIALYFAAATLLPLLATQGVEGMLHRLREGPDTHSRLVLWRNVLDLIAVHPWIGWGWGELKYAHFVTFFDRQPRFAEILDNAHNLPLHLAVELGVPAALLICGGFGLLVLASRPWREGHADRLLAWGVLGVILLHSLLEYPLWYGPFQVVFGVALGVLWARAPTRTGSAFEAVTAATAAAILAAIAYAAFDYTRVSQLYVARDERLARWRDDTLQKLGPSWLFADYQDFARLALTPVTTANAEATHRLATRVLHFSPEPRVLAKAIESARLLGLSDEAAALSKRFERAFPEAYSEWTSGRLEDN
ncbi:O-antigen ligase [Burkholderiales bacterium 8X]|nr:O-antigen ligase [Burkholderiales bacterium 8X]